MGGEVVEKNNIFLLAAMLLVSAWGCEGADSGRLSVTGGSLTDQRGEPVQLRGLSTHGIAWFPEYLTEGMLEPYPGENFMYAFRFYAGQHRNDQALKNARDRNIPVMVSEWGINLDENDQPALAAGGGVCILPE